MAKLTDKDCQNIYNTALLNELQEHLYSLISVITDIALDRTKIFESEHSTRLSFITLHSRELKRIISRMDDLDSGYFLLEEDINVIIEEVNEVYNIRIKKFLSKTMRNIKKAYSKENQDEMLFACKKYQEIVLILRKKLELLNSQGRHYDLPDIPELGY